LCKTDLLDQLFEVLLIQLLRQLMQSGTADIGLLSGLAHSQLRLAIVAMHQEPEGDWSVENHATLTTMSTSVFSNKFRLAVGETPASYLQRWRIGLVQKWLKSCQTLKLITE
jgi:transcriptional regulator GlxA family with amidase domain